MTVALPDGPACEIGALDNASDGLQYYGSTMYCITHEVTDRMGQCGSMMPQSASSSNFRSVQGRKPESVADN